MSEELCTIDKIEWLAENEGTELADGYNGLLTFLNYCCDEEDGTEIMSIIGEEVDYQYKETKIEMEEQGDWRDDRVNEVVNSLWENLMSLEYSKTAMMLDTDKEELKVMWAKKLKGLL